MKTALLCVALAACASSPPPAPPPAPMPAPSAESEPPDNEEPEPPPPVNDTAGQQPPSTASYEQAMATPESLDVHDERPHLNDDQLRAPMNTIPSKCPLPANAKVTVRTAVLAGRAIGVTVEVRFEHPPPKPRPGAKTAPKPKPPSRAAVQRETKAKKKLAMCIDRAVRALTWPPSNRRDSFTSEL